MKIVFASNFFNHHQKPLSEALHHQSGVDYHFIATEPISKERLDMGWGKDKEPAYVKYSYASDEEREACQKLIDEADVVILGSAPYALLKTRLKKGGLTFRYTERIYKTGCPYYKLPRHFYLNFKNFIRFPHFYLLCASAYTSADFAKTFTFLNKAYKWGYFTELKQYENIDNIIAAKKKNSLLWVARFIKLKHPEVPLEIAKRLKKDGYQFELNMIGNGVLQDEIAQRINAEGLGDCVRLLGSMAPERVRAHMEQSEIFLFTSDKNEGWGAVMNESMNSACVPIASHAVGSVPFLVDDGKNGYIYRDGDIDDLYNKVKSLLEDKERRLEMAKKAYLTMLEEWNAEVAAQKLLKLSEELLAGKKKVFPYENGVCSKAKVLSDKRKKYR